MLFWENPVFIPEEAPDGEEAGRNKEADVGANAKVIEAADDGVVEAKANGFDNDVAAKVLHFTQVFRFGGKGPVALDQVIERPANDVS